MKKQTLMTILLCLAMFVCALGGYAYGRRGSADVAEAKEKVTDNRRGAASDAASAASEKAQEESSAEEAADSTKESAESAEEASSASEAEEKEKDRKDGKKPDKKPESKPEEKEPETEPDDDEIVKNIQRASAHKTVDASTIAKGDEVLKEIDLPEGVESTLYGSDAAMQIVVLGDSQFGNFLGEDGLAYRLMENCDANVYNLAIGGTTCAMLAGEDESKESESLYGMVRTLTGELDPSHLSDHKYVYDVYQSCDFSKTDVFVIEYGLNDYLAAVPMSKSEEGVSQVRSFAGSLIRSVEMLKASFPDAMIIICQPTYAQFFDGESGAYLGDGNILSNGKYCLVDIARTVESVAGSEGDRVWFMDGYFELFNSYNAKDNLLDGMHMNADGRWEYGRYLSCLIINMMGYDISLSAEPFGTNWRGDN